VDEYYLPISALQHYAYCPRQCALIHIEQAWSENYWTAQGRLLHERVDSGEPETRGAVRNERGVEVISHELRLIGKLDLLEINNTGDSKKYKPVEYKRGKPKKEEWDRIQLCGQILCLEEMLNTEIIEAALWYWEVRQRETIFIDDNLRKQTLKIIKESHHLMASGITPKACYQRALCEVCSLLDICGVKDFKKDRSREFVEEIFIT